jgi:hypothetical protein
VVEQSAVNRSVVGSSPTSGAKHKHYEEPKGSSLCTQSSICYSYHMLQDQDGLLEIDTPLMFADGTETYQKFADEFVTHKKGYFIMGPSGIGKSYYVRRQKVGEKHWVDADQLWRKARAMPMGPWWEELAVIEQVEEQCDIVTAQAKRLGFWMLGSACRWLKPDAIVIPDWDTHVGFIKQRELNYDGGIKSDQLEQLKNHRNEILGWADQGVPKFKSVNQAIDYLVADYSKLEK